MATCLYFDNLKINIFDAMVIRPKLLNCSAYLSCTAYWQIST